MTKLTWPAWFNGPNGEAAIFQNESEVPRGWTSGAEKITVAGLREPAVPVAPTLPAGGTVEEIDADGHPWNAEIHAASKSKTKAGLWRMKVGATRPDPLPGFPKSDDANKEPAPLDL